MNDSKKNRGLAQVIVVDGDHEGTKLEILRKQFPGTLQILYGTAGDGNRIQHYIVADREMVRDEETHDPITDASDANKIKADVYFHSPAIAELFADRFDSVWKNLSPASTKS